MSIVVKRIPSSKPKDLVFPASTSLILNHGKEIKMAVEDITSKIEAPGNQIQ